MPCPLVRAVEQRTTETSFSSESAISAAFTEKQPLRSLVPIIISTTSIGRCVSRRAGKTRSPLRCGPPRGRHARSCGPDALLRSGPSREEPEPRHRASVRTCQSGPYRQAPPSARCREYCYPQNKAGFSLRGDPFHLQEYPPFRLATSTNRQQALQGRKVAHRLFKIAAPGLHRLG